MAEYSVSIAGETASFSTTPPVVVTPPVVPSSVPSLPEYVVTAGASLPALIAGLKSPVRLVLPVGVFAVAGNSVSGYSLYSPNLLGIRGTLNADGSIGSIIREVPDSWQTKAAVPLSAGNGFLRQGPNNSTSGGVTTLSDVRFEGADQVGAASGVPMNRAGLLDYWGRKAVWNNVELQGMSRGSGSSPATGETFAINVYRSDGSTFTNVRVDGRDASGNRVGGSPFGINGAKNITVDGGIFQYSYVSGVTGSHSGSGTGLTPSYNLTYQNGTIQHNANTAMESGKRFSGINNENVLGTNLVKNMTVTVDWKEWNAHHFGIAANHPDGATTTYTYIDNVVNDVGAGRNSGALTINLPLNYIDGPNTIKPENITVINKGVKLTPRVITKAPDSTFQIDPAKEFILIRG